MNGKSRFGRLIGVACVFALAGPAFSGDEDGPGGKVHFGGVGGVTNPVRPAEGFVPPRYPAKAREKGAEGKVILQAVIRKDGTVGEVKVLNAPEGDLGFAEAATESVRKWRYEPARLNGEPVDVYFTVVVDFQLQEEQGKSGEKSAAPPPRR